MSRESDLKVYTIGHSTRSLEEFIELLKIYGVTLLIDIRTAPHSRYNPQFNKETLPAHLRHYDIKYIHLEAIGGLHRPKTNSINLALKNASFRGYADYMQTKEFVAAFLKIIALSKENQVALMCAEALPWKCHRNLISDALVARHIKVLHIISREGVIRHVLNEMADVDGNKVTYPLYNKKTPQKMLSDFGSARS